MGQPEGDMSKHVPLARARVRGAKPPTELRTSPGSLSWAAFQQSSGQQQQPT